MTMLTEPHAPWLRDLNRLFTSEGAVASAGTSQPRELQESAA